MHYLYRAVKCFNVVYKDTFGNEVTTRSNELPQDLINTTSHIIKTISQVILLSHTHLMIMLLKINNINLKRLASNRWSFSEVMR